MSSLSGWIFAGGLRRCLGILAGIGEAERQTIFHFLNDPDSLNCLVLVRPGQRVP